MDQNDHLFWCSSSASESMTLTLVVGAIIMILRYP